MKTTAKRAYITYDRYRYARPTLDLHKLNKELSDMGVHITTERTNIGDNCLEIEHARYAVSKDPENYGCM